LVKPDQWVELPDTATVATGTATYDIDDKAMEHPFAVVSVRQDGSDTMVLQNLSEDVNFHNVYVGMPLKVVWAAERKGEWTDLDHYAPIDDKMSVDLNKKEGSIEK
jgi:uncharacterized OB-fold protein